MPRRDPRRAGESLAGGRVHRSAKTLHDYPRRRRCRVQGLRYEPNKSTATPPISQALPHRLQGALRDLISSAGPGHIFLWAVPARIRWVLYDIGPPIPTDECSCSPGQAAPCGLSAPRYKPGQRHAAPYRCASYRAVTTVHHQARRPRACCRVRPSGEGRFLSSMFLLYGSRSAR